MVKITKEKLTELVELSKSVPEEYRQKCFEVLLQNELGQITQVKTDKPPEETEIKEKPQSDVAEFTIPIDVKAFLSQYDLSESLLWKIFLAEGTEIRPLYKLTTTKKSKVQIANALLIALENAMITGQFQFKKDQLRDRLKSQKAYDEGNFSANLKNNAKLFGELTDDKPISLSPDGKSELADILEEFNG